jgi:hypothetical protein
MTSPPHTLVQRGKARGRGCAAPSLVEADVAPPAQPQQLDVDAARRLDGGLILAAVAAARQHTGRGGGGERARAGGTPRQRGVALRKLISTAGRLQAPRALLLDGSAHTLQRLPDPCWISPRHVCQGHGPVGDVYGLSWYIHVVKQVLPHEAMVRLRYTGRAGLGEGSEGGPAQLSRPNSCKPTSPATARACLQGHCFALGSTGGPPDAVRPFRAMSLRQYRRYHLQRPRLHGPVLVKVEGDHVGKGQALLPASKRGTSGVEFWHATAERRVELSVRRRPSNWRALHSCCAGFGAGAGCVAAATKPRSGRGHPLSRRRRWLQAARRNPLRGCPDGHAEAAARRP